MTVDETKPRRRNPRGQGDRLREDIVEAAGRLLADPAAPALTLRGVARAAGIATTSVYLHFNDTDALVLAVAERHFGTLVAAQSAAREAAADPRDAVHAIGLAYCAFGLANPGLYQVMFGSPLPAVADITQIPGRAAFEQRTDAVAAFLGSGSPDAAFAASMLIWQLLHGTVSLRISRPVFPWPPLERTLDRGIDLVLDDAAAAAHKLRKAKTG
ncbi:MAG TPA: TetR/AcrR family transcriptional regulator [Actinocrinis sp.]|jgi:AcrR family transcriptional regulator